MKNKNLRAALRPRNSVGASLIVRKTIELEPGRHACVDFNCAESPLSWLRTRKDAAGNSLIADEQYCAGLRLHSDFTASQVMPKITSNWQGSVGGRGARRAAPRNDLLHQSEKALAARQRCYAALEAVGPELSSILVEICCHVTGIEAAERLLGMPRRSGKVVLQIALTRLARFYGIIAPGRPAAESAIRHCAVDGYRPPVA
jgi:hypothetical protein